MKQYKSLHGKQMKITKVILIVLSVILAVGGIGYAYVKYGRQFFSHDSIEQIEPSDEEVLAVEVKDKKPEMLVHVAGAVVSPGVVELEEGARIKDAIDAAGGLLEKADIRTINLAAEVTDGTKVYIPKFGEELTTDSSGSDTQSSTSSDGKVNINTASKEELMKLPGVGASTADAIITERKKGKFKSIQDLKRISGIGDKKFEKLEPHIRV